MPYTLAKGIVWVLLALGLGFVLGLLVRSVTASRTIRRLRAEIARLRDAPPPITPDMSPDDLTVIEGLGPSAAELCHGIGIITWADLAATEVSLLQTLLDDAGARVRGQDPTTWPYQAGLLAEGRWEEFRRFVSELRAGHEGPP
jgi:predicted flap endonuclease-1-like 5' DNA nuclease